MDLNVLTCNEFIEKLASSDPVPGGGGVSALVGALGAALGSMVSNLTLGNKKYENVRDDITVLLSMTEKLRQDFADLVGKDAEGFAYVVEAMKMPRLSDAEKAARDDAMEKALKISVKAPYETVQKCTATLSILEALFEKGSRGVLSDVGVGAVLCGAALEGAALNVYANTKYMKDRIHAETLNDKTMDLVKDGTAIARILFAKTEDTLK